MGRACLQVVSSSSIPVQNHLGELFVSVSDTLMWWLMKVANGIAHCYQCALLLPFPTTDWHGHPAH
jgi:hypothetical protein